MKLMSSSLLVALAFTVSAAAPPAVPHQQLAAQRAPVSPERMELARRFVTRTVSTDKLLEEFRSMATAGADCTCDTNAKVDAREAEADKQAAARFLATVEPQIRARVPKLIDAYAEVYAREFSTDELQQMVSFADSPAGQHYLSRRLDLDTDDAATQQEQGLWQALMPAMQQLEKDECQAHTAQRIAAGDKKATCPLAPKDETAAG